MDELANNKYRKNKFEVGTDDVRGIEGVLGNLPSARHENLHGLETVTPQGDVELVNATGSRETDRPTTLSTLPLAAYEKDGQSHQVNLYVRSTDPGEYGTRADKEVAMFIVDQATDANGKKYLADYPGLLYRTKMRLVGWAHDSEAERPDAGDEGIEESELAKTVLSELDGVSGIKELAQAYVEQDQDTIQKLQGRLAEALKARDIDPRFNPNSRADLGSFSERAWIRKGYKTSLAEEEARLKYQEREAQNDRAWQKTSSLRKFGIKALLMATGRRGEKPKDYFTQKQREKNR